MAKKGFPAKPCPKCGSMIHARKKNHDCGWVMAGAAKTTKAPTGKKRGRPPGRKSAPAIRGGGGEIGNGLAQGIAKVEALIHAVGGVERAKRLIAIVEEDNKHFPKA